MRLSTRYTPHLLILLTAALIPVSIHSYAGFEYDDCRSTADLMDAYHSGASDDDRGRWMREAFAAFQWCEGTLKSEVSGLDLQYTVVRSYDSKKLYHRPEAALVKGMVPFSHLVEWHGEIPIQRVHYNADSYAVFVGYLLVAKSQFIENPYLFQLRWFPHQLVRGSFPTTLFFVYGKSRPSDSRSLEERATEWLVRSWQVYENACHKASSTDRHSEIGP